MKHATRREVARLLRQIAKQVEADATEGAIMDINGNRVGSYWFQHKVDGGHDFLLKIDTDNAAFEDE